MASSKVNSRENSFCMLEWKPAVRSDRTLERGAVTSRTGRQCEAPVQRDILIGLLTPLCEVTSTPFSLRGRKQSGQYPVNIKCLSVV